MSWSSIEFAETIRKTTVGRENQILSADIQQVGRFPVVDQGQAFIAGYSDAEERVIRDDLPLVVFGDHTRCLKFVDFPFILGADGTKVLKPKEELFDAKFFYYALLSFDIPSRGYNRHFTILKGKSVPRPERDEQRKIAGVLGVVQRAMGHEDALVALTTELKKALLHHLFTIGIRGETKKETDIGPVPESWDVVELINAVDQIDYGISAPIPKTPPDNGVKIVSTADITKDGRLLYQKIRRINAPEKIVSRLTLQTGDVLFNWRNSAGLIGKSAVFQEQDEPHVFASFILRIKCDEGKCHNLFLAHLMNYFRETSVFLKLARRAVNQANYNRNEISVLKIPKPTYQEQREIADAIGAVDVKIQHHRQKKSKLEDLFRTLLHQLMIAQIRVKDLNLNSLEGSV